MADIPANIKNAVRDLHWMARRYADGRCSYAPGMFNGRVRDLLAAGFELGQPLFARDGMGRAFDGLTEEEVAAAKEDGFELHAELNAAEPEDRMNAVWDQAVEACMQALSGKTTGCTLGPSLAALISEEDACKLLNMQRLVDIEALRSLKRSQSQTEEDNG
jgi:hypothetical protein